ncbi:MAG: hypothetical protein ACXVY5_07645 [Gaiellales bacterium]
MAIGVLGAGALPVLAVGSNHDPDFRRASLFRDGSIGCTGADDTTYSGGRVLALAQPGHVFFTVKLRRASPNTQYTLAVSEEPSCSNAQFYTAQTTNSVGAATFYGVYNTTSGKHNLLFNLVTTTPDTPINREIGTANFRILVP